MSRIFIFHNALYYSFLDLDTILPKVFPSITRVAYQQAIRDSGTALFLLVLCAIFFIHFLASIAHISAGIRLLYWAGYRSE